MFEALEVSLNTRKINETFFFLLGLLSMKSWLSNRELMVIALDNSDLFEKID